MGINKAYIRDLTTSVSEGKNKIIMIMREINLHFLFIHFLAKILWPLFYKNLGKCKAINVMKENWDYLIVLDACRYDLFQKVVDEGANFVISGGTSTQEWLKWNFGDKYNNVIYIAGNPHLASANLKKTLGFHPFYLVKEVWDYGWDHSLKTVPPEEVTNAALNMIKLFPEKNLIIHYNQPHHPFLSDKEMLEKDDGTWHKLKGGMWGGEKITIWDLAKQGDISIIRIINAYKENLKIVWKEVEKLKKKLPGKIIVTSDHGNLIGEYGIYGHGGPLRAEGLVKVPWMILKDEEKDITKDGIKRIITRERIRKTLIKLKR